MITEDPTTLKRDYGAISPPDPFAGLGAAFPPPPSFEESVAAGPSSSTSVAQPPLIDPGAESAYFPPGGEAPPPAFAPYDAEHALAPDGSVYTHDAHLNADGEALFRFLLAHAATPPQYTLHIAGTHTEMRTRLATHEHNGRRETRTETYEETVTDFDFAIDVGQHLARSSVVHWSVPDEQPAYRGRMVRDVGLPPNATRARRKDTKAADVWQGVRDARGLPPWLGPRDAVPDAGAAERGAYGVLQSSWTLRQWADDYCASPKYLKEFEYTKVVYGWNTDALLAALRACVLSTGYRGKVDVRFETRGDRILIRSSNRLSRALSNRWIKFLLIITLIYPFIWLFRRYARTGGGHWAVCGGAYALKAWADVPRADLLLATPPDPFVDDDVSKSGEVAGRRLVQTAAGIKVLVGVREGEWLREWEATIRAAVAGRRQDRTPLVVPDARAAWNGAAAVLDGYLDS